MKKIVKVTDIIDMANLEKWQKFLIKPITSQNCQEGRCSGNRVQKPVLKSVWNAGEADISRIHVLPKWNKP